MIDIFVGIYVRVSTEEQKEHGYSIPQQIDILTKLANNNKWKVYKIYNDAGISGKNTEDRPMLKELIHDITNKKISKVLITKMDRLSRNVIDTDTLLNFFNKFNCELIDSSGRKIEASNPSDWLFTIIQSAFGQYERKAIINRVKDGFAGKVKQGKSLCSSTPPYGYNREKGNGVLSVDEEEVLVVKRIYYMYLDNYSFAEIARMLNIEKVATKRSNQIIKKNNTKSAIITSRWTSKTIRLLLSNPTYIGKVRYHLNKADYQEYEGLHESIIDLETYKQVQNKIKKTKRIFRTNKPKEEVYYCGTLVCGYCNKSLTTQRTKKHNKKGEFNTYYGYRCSNKEHGICNARGMSHKKVEEAFIKYISQIDYLKEFSSLDIRLNDNNKIKELKDVNKSITKFKNKKEEILNLFIEDKIDEKQMQYMTKDLSKKEKVLNQKRLKLESILSCNNIDLKSISRSIKVHWKYLTNREKYDFLNQFIMSIVVINDDNDKVKGKIKILSINLYD
ncbi:MAG: recombinase family protein [Bacilli bacterium]|nr:recombinase family protein [Bacilli bacterium]